MEGRCAVSPYWVSLDGSQVARCYEGATLVFFDADTGRELDHTSLVLPRSADADEAAQRFLGFEPLRRYVSGPDSRHPRAGSMAVPPREATGEGLVVRYVAPHLIVQDRSGRVLAKRAFPAWRADSFDDDGCHAPRNLQGLLRDAWGHRDRGVFVLDLVGTSALEACGGVSHVVRIAPLAYVPESADASP